MKNPSLTENQLSKIILDAAFKVHTLTGPGLLESVYEVRTYTHAKYTHAKDAKDAKVLQDKVLLLCALCVLCVMITF